MLRKAPQDAHQNINVSGLGLRMGRGVDKDILFIFVYFSFCIASLVIINTLFFK